MNTQAFICSALVAASLSWLTGCGATRMAPVTQETIKYTIESTEKLDLRDRAVQEALRCTGLQERVLPDGRLEVVTMLRNRAEEPVKVQLLCVFRDAEGLALSEEIPSQVRVLAPGMTEAVRFTATDVAARKFTVQVRSAR